jgi:hypothetical protein
MERESEEPDINASKALTWVVNLAQQSNGRVSGGGGGGTDKAELKLDLLNRDGWHTRLSTPDIFWAAASH